MDILRKGKRHIAKISSDLRHGSPGSRSGRTTPNLVTYPTTTTETDLSVPQILLTGTKMMKISEKKQNTVVFKLDPDEGQILYESRKNGIIPIEAIKELRTGINARYYRTQYKFEEEVEARWITIVYILEGTYKTMHIIAETRDVFQLWDTTLRKLVTIRQGLMTGLDNMETRQTIWERQYWKGADVEGDQKLDFKNVEGLCKRLNVNSPPEEMTRIFNEADRQKRGYLDFADFQYFVKLMRKRSDVEALYGSLTANGPFNFAVFETFMRDTQKSILPKDELEAIFVQYISKPASTGTTTTPVDATVPTSTADTSANTKKAPEVLTLDGFTSFLLSKENSAFSEPRVEWQDITRPLSEYYISSSHNTYLVGHQLVGVSTIEGYIRALLHGCRSVELDIYDGDVEPVVYHGKTLTSKVPLRDICQAIARYAFVTSPYPVIISAEVHCNVQQQDVMVKIMNETLGEALVSAPVEGRPTLTVLPSPDDLKGKFLLKAKNLYVVALGERLVEERKTRAAIVEADASSSSSEEDETPRDTEGVIKELKSKWRRVRGKEATPASSLGSTPLSPSGGSRSVSPAPPTKPKVRMSFALTALLVYTVGVKCHGINGTHEYAPEHIFSLSETTANKVLKVSMRELAKHCCVHVVRIYPRGTRVKSSNYEPVRYWAAGCQVVAINWQTFDLGYMINQAMFLRNGKSGYVLKPKALRDPTQEMLKIRTWHSLDITVISGQQLPRPKDSHGQEIIGSSVMDPYVEVSLHVPDWAQSAFFPPNATSTVSGTGAGGSPTSPLVSSPALNSPTTKSTTARTQVVKNNGFNPVWREKLSIPFDLVGGPGAWAADGRANGGGMEDVIFVQFAVRQKGWEGEGEEPLAVYCSSLGCLALGYRHLPLHDLQLAQHLFSTLFVHVAIRDA